MNNDYEICNTAYNSLAQEQMSPFGKESEIDFIEEDEASYYAMADDIKHNNEEIK